VEFLTLGKCIVNGSGAQSSLKRRHEKSGKKGQKSIGPPFLTILFKSLCSVEFYITYYLGIIFILGIYYVGNCFLLWKAKNLNYLTNKNLVGFFGGDHFPPKEERNMLFYRKPGTI
jgi:hypothetical protein